MKTNTLDGPQIKESSLGTVPSAQHAATADTAGHEAAKAADADKVGGMPRHVDDRQAACVRDDRRHHRQLREQRGGRRHARPRPRPCTPSSAKLTYDNDGASSADTCTLHVPGADDTTSFVADNTETIALQKITNSDAVFNPTVTCTGDGTDDLYGTGRITAIRLD